MRPQKIRILSSHPKREEEIPNITHWLKANQCSLVMPNQVYHKGKHIGTLNAVDSKLVFIPSITWEEWDAIDKAHPHSS
jgi:hypothetical protein